MRLFGEFVNDSSLPAIKARPTLSSNIAVNHQNAIMRYAVVAILLLTVYSAYVVVTKRDEEIHITEQNLLAVSDASKSYRI